MNDHDLEVNDIKDIADFLAKPMAVSTGTFTTANVWGDTLLSTDIFSLFNSQSIWTNKIQGFLNMRADVKLRLVINPTPFQAGMLRLSYFPCANQMQNEMNSHLLNRTTISQLPGAYLNLENNFVEVTVPYVAPTTFIERDQVASGSYVSWGQVLIHVFEILRTGTGPTSINWTLWMSLENLELSGMVQPQSAAPSSRKRKTRGLPPQDAEANSGKGPIGKIMSSGAQLATDLGAIPLLSTIATPASWVLSAIGCVCDVFGWSKPTLTEGPCYQAINQNTYSVNTKGNDNCAPLSLDPDNKIQCITDAAPGGMDELSFNFVKSRWGFFADVQWSTSAIQGTAISNFDMSLTRFRSSQTVNGLTVYSALPCAVSQEIYSMYRGSFEVRVRLVKTGFHTGTLAIGFVPGLRSQLPSFADSAYTYRQIIDIQDGSDFVFTCPYLIAQEFVNNSDSIGKFFIYVVNPLVAPATVASTIDVFLEVRGGPDMQYAVPKGLSVIPFVPQGIDNDNSGEATSMVLGSRVHDFKNVHHSALSTGEVQLSYLEIMKATYPLLFAPGIKTPSSGGDCYYIGANRIYAARYDGFDNTASELGGDLISFIGSWYALSRGSQRLRVLPLTPSTTGQSYRGMFLSNDSNDSWTATANSNGQTWWTNDAPFNSSNAPFASLITSANPTISSAPAGYSNRVFQTPPINSGISVQTPFYSKYRYDLNHFVTATGSNQLSFTANNGAAFYTPGIGSAILTRSLGDDFQFSYFVGVPCYTSTKNFFNENG